MKLIFFTFILITSLFAQEAVDISLKNEAQLGLRNALKYMEKAQMENGSWMQYPAVTALAVSAFLNSPFESTEWNSRPVADGLKFILSCQQADGGIYIDDQKTYNTSICLVALVDANNPDYANAIRRARDFLLNQQLDETQNITRSDVLYGGIGYNTKGGADLSNLAWALESLKKSDKYRRVSEATGKPQEQSTSSDADIIRKELFWDKALVFIQRCQNLKETNDQSWASTDGGFVYSPSESKAGDYTSYGSMTYAGMKSFIYAGLDKNDKRVQAVYQWIKNNYTVEKNPAMGEQGLFYYYHTMAKALDVYGENFVTDEQGNPHNWRKDLISKLLSIQNGEGYWLNQNNRWWENNKELVTAYSILAIEYALK